MVERWLGFADAASGSPQRAILEVFRRLILLHVAFATALRLAGEGFPNAVSFACAIGVVPACVLGLWPGRERLGAAVAALLQLALAVSVFPAGSNHSFMELVALALVAVLDPRRPAECRLLGQALRWVVVIALFYTGLQKLLYGTYFEAVYLGYAIATREHFADFFAWLLPAAELARLVGLPEPSVTWHPDGTATVASGSYAVQALPVVIVSNLTWLAEMTLPFLLLWRRTRALAAVAAMGLVASIQFAARELFFAALMFNWLLLFTRRAWNRRLFPLFVTFYLVLAASRLGFIPRFLFYQ